MKIRAAACLVVIVLVSVLLPSAAQGSGLTDDRFARLASNSIAPFIIVGGLSLLSVGKHNPEEYKNASKAMVATGLATELLKTVVREKRPNSDSRASFPSGHTSAAFAMATVLSDYRPRLTLPAYGVAATIGWSRVELREHRWRDVAAGAALGYVIAKHYTGKHLSVSPEGVGLNWRL